MNGVEDKVAMYHHQGCLRCVGWAIACAATWMTAPLSAVVVSTTTGNINPPLDDPGWSHVGRLDGDPGTSAVYLGDSWVITAAHTFLESRGIPRVTLDGADYRGIPGTVVTLKHPGPGGGESDVRMFRIDGKPDLADLVISESTPPVAGEVVMIGVGRQRLDEESFWDSDWNFVDAGDNWRHHGFRTFSPHLKRWGTNRLVNEEGVLRDGDGDIVGEVTVGSRTVISMFTRFDADGTDYEAHAMSGDSGGGVFFQRGGAGGAWELTGLIHATFPFSDQRGGWAVFGNHTAISDLASYRDEIEFRRALVPYSVMGDINLDGLVQGDGTGPWESDDVTAFVDGWLSAQPIADIDSWKKGDLNRDGITNLSDFILLRSALPETAALASLLAGAHVPEPSSLTLTLVALSGWIACRRRRA